ncbi:MAG: tetratricopeptide repeat protein [Methanocorpusculum sp.]|nr:tetratricopeptide repeat protein [Methanocorpusculum sp.]
MSDLIEEAGDLALSGKFEEAVDKYSEAIAADPKNPLAYIEKAAVLKSINRCAEAVLDLDSALKILPDWSVSNEDKERYDLFYSMLLILKAEALLSLQKYDKCLIVLDSADSIRGADADSLVVRAQVFARQNKFDEAFDCLYKAEEWCFLNSDEMLTQVWLLKIHLAKDFGNMVAPPYAEIIYRNNHWKKPTGTADELFERGNNLRDENLMYDALHYYDACLEANPKNRAIVLFFKGIIFERMKNYSEAFSCYSDALAAEPEAEDEFKIRVRWANAKLLRGVQ